MIAALTAFLMAGQIAQPCVDPARDLRALMLEHVVAARDETLGTDRMVDGLRRYLETGTRTDQLTAVTRYTNLGTGRYSRRDLVLGVIYASSPDVTPERTYGYRNRRLLLYSKTEDMGFRHLEDALERHPDDWMAGVAMARMALGVRAPARLAQARRALEKLLARDSSSTVVRIAIADLLIAQDSAALARDLVRDAADGCAPAAHALAEALILTGDSAQGAKVYLDALTRAGDQLDRFMEDVLLTLPYDDRLQAERVAPAERITWLQDWWDRSAARSARTLEARVAEHLARITYAQLHYRKENNPVEPLQNASDRLLVSIAPPWDARGEIHIRHGVPDTVVSSQTGTLLYLPRNESWVYARGDVNWVFHFVWEDRRDWRLASPWIGCGGSGGPNAFREFNPSSSFRVPSNPAGAHYAADYYAARAPFDTYSAALMRHCQLVWGGSGDVRVQSIVRRAQEDYDSLMIRSLRTESARHRLRHRIRLRANAYAFRDAGGNAESVAVLWVPKSDVGGMPTGSVYVEAAVVGDEGRPLRRDTLIEFSQLQAGSAPVLAFAMTWRSAVPAGARLYALARDGLDDERGAYVDRDLPSAPAARALSSLVVAAPERGGPLQRGDVGVWPHPDHTVLMGESFRLFFEMYGLRPDEPIRTRIAVEPVDAEGARSLLQLFSGRRADRVLEFDDIAAPDARGTALQDVEIGGDLVPGDYTITVEVRAGADRLTRTGRLVVRESAAGG